MTWLFSIELGEFTEGKPARGLLGDNPMETLLDPYELLPAGSDPAPVMRMRQRMKSVIIDVEWDEPPPPSSTGRRVWMTED